MLSKKTLAVAFLGVFVLIGLFFCFKPISAQINFNVSETDDVKMAIGLTNNTTVHLSSGDIVGKSGDGISHVVAGMVNSIIFGIPIIIVEGAYRLAALANYIDVFLLNSVFVANITTDNAYYSTWQLCRDLGNMVIVLGFVIIGIATALRIQQYSAKQLLIKLIIAAITINYSLFFCQTVIDASNKLTKSVVNTTPVSVGAIPGTATYWTGSLTLARVNGAARFYLDKELLGSGSVGGEFIGGCFMFTVVYLVFALTSLVMAAVIVARYVALVLLFIVSPLAFAFTVLPATQSLASQWWQNFLKWAFVGVLFTFIMWLVGSIAKVIPEAISKGEDSLSTVILPCILITIFMLIGTKIIAQQNGVAAKASGAIISTATSVGSMAAAGAGFVAGVATRAAGKGGAAALSKLDQRLTGGKGAEAMQKISAGVGARMEKLGLQQEGTTAQRSQKSMEDTAKRMGSLSEQRQTQIAGRSFGSPAGDRAAAIQNKIKNRRLSDLGGLKEQQRAVSFLESHYKGRGMDSSGIVKEAYKQNPNLQTDPAKRRELIQGQAPKDFAKNIDAKSISPEVLEAMDEKQVGNLCQNAPADKRNAVKNLVETPEGRAQINAYSKTLGKDDPARANLARNIKSARAFTKPPKESKESKESDASSLSGRTPPKGSPDFKIKSNLAGRTPPKKSPGFKFKS